MKISQISAIVVSLLISLGIVTWLVNSVPATVFEDSQADIAPVDEDAPPPEPPEEGVQRTNPFDLTTAGPHPKAVLAKKLHDFGTMALGQTGHYDFVIQNTGEAPLKLAKGAVQCKCTVSGLKEDEILPGEEAKVHLEWTPKSLGEFGQGAIIWTNDPENSELEIRVEGKMVPEMVIEPANGWILGTVPSGKAVPLTGQISTALYESFDIVSVETSSDHLVLEVVPFTAAELEENGVKVGYHLTGEYNSPDDSGAVREQVVIKTTLKEKPEITLNVSGSRTGPVAIIGPGWTAGRSRLDLSRIEAAQGKSHKLTFMVEPFEEEFEVLEIQTKPEFVKARLEAESNSATAKRQRFTFYIDVPADSPKGVWPANDPGEIVLKTNHPKLSEIRMQLEMMIQ